MRLGKAGQVKLELLAGVYYSQRAPVPPMMTTINPSGILTIMIWRSEASCNFSG
jgi:hypothetical protein